MAPCHKSNTYRIGTPWRSYRNLHQKRRNSLTLSDSRVNLCMEVSNSAWWYPHHGTTGFNLPIPEVLIYCSNLLQAMEQKSERAPERTIVRLDSKSDWMASRQWLTNWAIRTSHCDTTVIEEYRIRLVGGYWTVRPALTWKLSRIRDHDVGSCSLQDEWLASLAAMEL